jgi:hypothetical protein
MSNEEPPTEDLRNEEPPKVETEPTMLNVRSEGLKLDLVLLKNTVSGLTIDYQNVAGSKDLHKWLGIIDGMTSGSAPSTESIPQIPGEAASVPASQSQPPRGGQEGFPGNDYRRIVLDAVDATLDTLGSGGKQTVLSLLENRYGLREKDIPEHPRGFVELLEVLLGTPARTLERGIMSNIWKVAAAPGENLDAVVKSLKEHQQATAPVEAATADLQPIETNASPVAIATTEEQEKPSEEHGQNPDASEDPIPTGFRFSLTDPIPVRFTHNATYSTRRG